MEENPLVCRTALLAALCLIAFPAMAGAADLEVFVVDTAFSPRSVAGQITTIRGIGFTPSTTVSFNAAPGTTNFVDSRTLTVTVPTFGAGTISTVTVSDPVNGDDTFFPYLHTTQTYYVSTAGSDSNNGTSPSTPWRTIFKAMDVVDAITVTEVRVAGGVYLEADTAVWNGVALSCGWDAGFTARDPDAHITVIDAQNTGFAARSAGIQSAEIIDGCTLANGFRDGLGGGGVVVSADSMIVNNSVIVGNTSSLMGGGIYFIISTAYGGTSTFSNNVIIGNRAHNKNGGGIVTYANYNTQEPVRVNVAGNEIVGNRSFKGRGGGVALATSSYAGYNNGVLKMAGNTIAHNRAKTGGGAAVTFFTFGDLYELSVDNNLLFGNLAEGAGGGFAFEGAGMIDGTLSCNTIADNAATPGLAGGLLIDGAMTIIPGFESRDMILWNNAGGDAGGHAYSTTAWSDAGEALPGPGNISQDPLFAEGPLGGYYLTQDDPNSADSPSVDGGSDSAAGLSVDGLTTRIDGGLDAGSADMGYHYRAADGDSPAALSISRLDPSRGDLHGSDWVLIRGDGFDPGASVVFDGIAADGVRFLGNRRLLARPAGHPLGIVDVTVTNPDASFATAAAAFEYVDNHPPVWSTTVGPVILSAGQDCVRSAVLEWNPAFDLDTPPIVYDVYREECIDSGNTSVPCSNFGYFPRLTNRIGTTFEQHFTDTGFPGGGVDKKWVYAVRARDSASPANSEYNFAKKLGTVGTTPGDVTPPPDVGLTLQWITGSTTDMDWAAPVGADRYGLYRELSATPFANPGAMTPFLVLNSANNDLDANGVVDSSWVENDVPAFNQIYFYRITAIDPCGNETTSELLP